MKLYEEFKLYENMWDDTVHKEAFSKKADLAFKRALIKALKDKDKNLAKQVNDCTIICTDKVAAGTAVYEQGTIYVHTNLSAAEQMDSAIAAIKKALVGTVTEAKNYSENLQEATASWEAEVANADNFLDAIIKATSNENYDDGDGYWEAEGTTWCNRYLYYGNSLNNTSLIKDLCALGSTKIPNAKFYYIEDDLEEGPVSEIGYTLTKASVAESLVESDDPYGYGPYKNFSDPDLKVGDYVLTTRPFSRGGRTYPARITSISSKWIEYEISGFGFTDKGTKARPGSASDSAIRKAAAHLGLNKRV